MAAPIATLLVDIRSDVGKLQKDLDRTRQQLGAAMRKMNKSAELHLKLDGVKAALQVFSKIGKAAIKAFKTVTDAAATVQFNANMDELEKSWQGFIRSIGESITRSEAFNEALRVVSGWVEDLTGKTDGLGTAIGDTLAVALIHVKTPLAWLHGALVAMHGTVGGLLLLVAKFIRGLSYFPANMALGLSDGMREVATNLEGVSGDNFKDMAKEANAAVAALGDVDKELAKVKAKLGGKSTSAHTGPRGKGAKPSAAAEQSPMVFEAMDFTDVQGNPDNRAAQIGAEIAVLQPAMDGLIASMDKLNERAANVMNAFTTLATDTAGVMADAVLSPLEDGFFNIEAMLDGLKQIVIDLIKQLLVAVALKLILAPESYAAGAAKTVGGGLLSAIGFAQGGKVPGSGSGDTVPAWLTPGEFVVPADTVRKYGSSFFSSLQTAPRFAAGGMVGAAGPYGGGSGGGSTAVYVSAIDPKTTRDVVASRIEAAQGGRFHDRQGDRHRRELQRAAQKPRTGA